MGGVWALGVVVAVALAFAAVGRVAHGVAPHDVARLSQTAIDDELSGVAGQPTSALSTSAPDSSTTTTAPPSAATTLTPSRDTVTSSQGGTLFTHCSGPDAIVYVAAVPRAGYARVGDVEEGNRVEQTFENGDHHTTVEAWCADGLVKSRIEDEGPGDD
jgi:hypothetical protein